MQGLLNYIAINFNGVPSQRRKFHPLASFPKTFYCCLKKKKPFTRIVCTVCYPLNFNIQNFPLNDFEYMEFKIIIECYSYQPSNWEWNEYT